MKNKSEMNSLRYIVHRSFDQLFDTSHMWKTHFKSMSFDSFRKYVSRLIEENELIPVGKGLYYVGKELPPDIENRICNYFLDSHGSCYGETTLLYRLNLIDEEPKNIVILSSMVKGNRKIGKVVVKSAPIFPSETSWRELFELLSLKKYIDEEHLGMYSMHLAFRIPKNDMDLRRFMYSLEMSEISYPRIVYIRLAELLNQLHISNEVMQWYEYKLKKSC